MDTAKRYATPPFDPELEDLLVTTSPIPPTMDIEQMVKGRIATPVAVVDAMLAARDLVREDRTVPGADGAPDLTVAVIRKRTHVPGGPGIYFVHGGGMVGGDRFTTIDRALEWAEVFDAVVVSPEYRLAPEHPDPAPLADCVAGLAWTASEAIALGFDPARLLVAGGSSGGGLAAGATLLARDRGGPALAGQILIGPMLDDRNDTISSHQVDGIGVWTGPATRPAGRPCSAIGAGPTTCRSTPRPVARPTCRACRHVYRLRIGRGLPRDKIVAYATRIWVAGGTAELHVWPGAHHGFDGIFPSAALSIVSPGARAPSSSGASWSVSPPPGPAAPARRRSAAGRPPRRSPRGARPSRCPGSAASPGCARAARPARPGRASRRGRSAISATGPPGSASSPGGQREPRDEADALSLAVVEHVLGLARSARL